MVRIKHRYLLVQVLSPTLLKASGSSAAKDTPSTLLTPKPHSNKSIDHLLAIHAPTPDNIDTRKLIGTIRHALAAQFGDYGASVAGSSGLKMMYWSNATSTFIIRCRREVVRLVQAALCFVRTIPGLVDPARMGAPGGFGGAQRDEREIVMRVVRASGTVKKALEEVIRRNKLSMGRLKGMQTTVTGMQRGAGNDVDADQEVRGALGLGSGTIDVEDDEDMSLDAVESGTKNAEVEDDQPMDDEDDSESEDG